MKRLRYWLWALVVCIEQEIEPLPCEAQNTNADPKCIAQNCECTMCLWPTGHPGLHESRTTGVKWQ